MLLTDVEDHEWDKHSRRLGRTLDDMTSSPRYVAADAAVFHEVLRETGQYDRLTREDIEFLLKGKVLWMGDTRLPLELAKRYKPKQDYLFD